VKKLKSVTDFREHFRLETNFTKTAGVFSHADVIRDLLWRMAITQQQCLIHETFLLFPAEMC